MLSAHLPASYPSTSAPILEISAPHLNDGLTSWAAAHLDSLFQPGEVVLFTYIEWLKEQSELYGSGAAAQAARAAEDDAGAHADGSGDEGDFGDLGEEGFEEGPPEESSTGRRQEVRLQKTIRESGEREIWPEN